LQDIILGKKNGKPLKQLLDEDWIFLHFYKFNLFGIIKVHAAKYARIVLIQLIQNVKRFIYLNYENWF
jgi:hypothetical protein